MRIKNWIKFNERFDLLKQFPEVEQEFKKPSRTTQMGIEDPTVARLKRVEIRIERVLSCEEVKMFISKLRSRSSFFRKDLVSFLSDVEDKLADEMENKTFEVIEEFSIKARKFKVGDKIFINEHGPGSACDYFEFYPLTRLPKSGAKIKYRAGCYVIEDKLQRTDDDKKKADVNYRASRFDI